MNLLKYIAQLLGMGQFIDAGPRTTTYPVANYSRRRSLRGYGDRERGPGAQNMKVEEFADKELRNARFRELREAKTPHVSKYSTVRDNKSVWCVVRP